jgi:hypothetical protein
VTRREKEREGVFDRIHVEEGEGGATGDTGRREASTSLQAAGVGGASSAVTWSAQDRGEKGADAWGSTTVRARVGQTRLTWLKIQTVPLNSNLLKF